MLVSAWAMLLAGTIVLLAVDLPLWMRVAAAIVWWAEVVRSALTLASAQRSVVWVRLAASGNCKLAVRGAPPVSVSLSRGTVVTARWAWLRLRSENGVYSELFLRGAVETESWRRLQVLWRWGRRG